MKFKKILKILLFIAIFGFCVNVEATCYKKTNAALINSGLGYIYTTSCVEDGSDTCEIVDNSYCGIIEDSDQYDNYDPNAIVSCGDGLVQNIPSMFPKVIRIVIRIIQVAVPVVLVVMGSMDLVKGITAQKEDEIKKGQQMFIKRLIAAIIVFFVFVIVKVLISVVADTTSVRIIDCAECFIENNCD